MKVTYRDGIYIAVCTLDENHAPRQAGFSRHPGLDECPKGPATCKACRVNFKKGWWTKRAEVAVRLSAHADQYAKRALTDHIKAVELSRATDADIEIPHPPDRDYFPYQKAGIAYMVKRDATLLGDDMGLGKSAQALGVINYDKTIKNVLVVCPAALRPNWLREAKMWIVKDERKWIYHVIDEDLPIPPEANFVIANYNRITVGYQSCKGPCKGEKKQELMCPACKGTGDGPQRPLVCSMCGGKKYVYCPDCKGRGKFAAVNVKLVESIHKRQWDILVIDECHFVKNSQAARTKAVLGNPAKRKPGLVDISRKKLFLTGTPLPNRPVEMWPVLSVCAPKAFGNFKNFTQRYCAAHEEWVSKTKKVIKVDGASNLEELQEKLRSTCFPYETLVSTERGPIPIGEIVENQLPVGVWSKNLATGVDQLQRVLAFNKRTTQQPLVKIIFKSGELICTADHQIWVEGQGYKRADSLNRNDRLSLLPKEGQDHRGRWTLSPHDPSASPRSMEGEGSSYARVERVEILQQRSRIGSIERCRQDHHVYCLQVEGNENFYANRVLVSNCMIRRLKRDVLKDLPPKTRQIVTLAPTDKAKKLIAEEMEIWQTKFGDELDIVHEVLAAADNKADPIYEQAAQRLKYIQGVAFMEMARIRKEVAVAKLPNVIEHISSMWKEGVDKIICFAHHKEVITTLATTFGEKAVVLFGETRGGADPNDPKNERQQAIDRFQKDPRVKLFIGGIMAAGTGLTLTASNHVVFAELDWTPSNVTQAEDRAHRIGQKNNVLVQHLVLDGSLDARMVQMLVEKQEIADRTLDKSTDVAVKNILETRPEAPVEPVPTWKKIVLKEAMTALAQRRDPNVEGSHGFSSFDAPIGQRLATIKYEYSDKQAHLALKFAKRYRRQLDDSIQKRLDIWEPPSPIEAATKKKAAIAAAIAQAREDKKQARQLPKLSLFEQIQRKATG